MASKEKNVEVEATEVTKAGAIRAAFEALGIDAPAKEISDYISTNYGHDVKGQYIYMERRKVKAKAEGSGQKAKRSRKNSASSESVGSVENFVDTVKTIRQLIDSFGGKESLIEAIQTV